LKNSKKEKSVIEEQNQEYGVRREGNSVKLSNISLELESQVMVKENKYGKMMVHKVRSK